MSIFSKKIFENFLLTGSICAVQKFKDKWSFIALNKSIVLLIFILDKVVIVIEGVDKFIDSETGKEANIAFWLPECFPKNVKVIVTASQGS
jgi:hypothetical protein